MKKILITAFVLIIGFSAYMGINKADAGYYYTGPAPYTSPWSSGFLGGNLFGGNMYTNEYNTNTNRYNYQYTQYPQNYYTNTNMYNYPSNYYGYNNNYFTGGLDIFW